MEKITRRHKDQSACRSGLVWTGELSGDFPLARFFPPHSQERVRKRLLIAVFEIEAHFGVTELVSEIAGLRNLDTDDGRFAVLRSGHTV